MLLDREGRKDRDERRVALLTRSREVSRLLAALFENWRLTVTDDLPSAGIVFAEWGLAAPEERRVWLAPTAVEGPHLTLPLSLTRLYRYVEERFYTSSRSHIRVTHHLPASLVVAGQSLTAELLTLSARGGRFSCSRDFAPGTRGEVEMTLAGRWLSLPCEVLYTLPAGDVSARTQPQVGVLFKPIAPRLVGALTRVVEQVCVEQACARAGLPMPPVCRDWIDLPRDPWAVPPA